jgi:hypothetical protein
VSHALNCDRLEGRVGEDNFLETSRGRIAFVGRVEIGPEHFAESSEFGKEIGQDAIGLGIDRIVSFAAGEAFAHLGVETVTQYLNATARERGQVAGVQDRLAMKPGEEQAEKFDASLIDGRARWQGRSGIEVIDAAVGTVGA